MIGNKLLDRYELTAELGHGGMGVVYRARDPLLDREVAVKMLPPGFLRPETEKRFRHEARVVAQMDHPAIVPIYDFGYHEDSLFLVMPVVQGATLRSLLRAGGLRLGEVLEIAIQVADALDYSHALGVIHRDVKPENVMVARERGALRVRVMDFGLARDASTASLTQGSGILGTVAYMSPEQVSAETLDGRTDLYSLGAVLYECLTGEPPFAGAVHAVVLSIVRDHPRSPRARGIEVSEELDEIVMACLAKEPAARPASGKELAQALQRCAAQLDEGALLRSLALTTKLTRPERPRSPLVGRKSELLELRKRLDAALAGECQLVLLAGDAGIGKGRLLEELATLARARGIRVLQGRFADRRSALPYQGFCELVQDYFRSKETTTATSGVANFSDLAPELLALFPMFSEIEELRTASSADEAKPPADAPATAGPRDADAVYVFELLARTLTRLAGGKPLVLLLRNLHAADVSVEALGYLVRRLGPTPTLIAGAYRPSEIDRAHPLNRLLESFSDDPRCSRIALGPLSREELRELVEAEVGEGELDDDSLERLYDSSEGNPLFARELITSLRESTGLRRDASGVWVLARGRGIVGDALPKTIQQAIRKRLDRLPEAQRKVLSVAAVLGRSFDYEDLEALTGDGELEEVIDALLAGGFLEEERRARGDRMSFTSGVVHDVVYHELPRRRRRSLHRQHAYQLEQRHAGRLERVYPRLVHHFSEGDVAEKTVSYGLELARRSLEAMNPEEAMRSSKTALEFVDEEDLDENGNVRGELLLILARAERMARDLDSALAHAETAAATLAADQPATAAAAALLAAETAWQARQGDETRRWVERGCELARSAGARETLRQLLTLGATVANLRGEHREAKLYLDEAERLTPLAEEPVTTAAEKPVPDGGTLVTALPATVISLDPGAVQADEEIEIAANVFETLLVTAEGHPAALLSRDWTSSVDGKKFAVKLHPEVRFSDGRALGAVEVKASLERAARLTKAGPPAALAVLEGLAEFLAGDLGEIAGIEISSDRELVFRLSEPLPIFPSLLTDLRTAIVREVAGGEGGTLLGTGPFRLAEPADDRLVLERNPNYWRGAPAHLDRLEFRTLVDASAIAAGLRAGEIDLGRDLYPQDLEELLRDSRFRSGLVEATKKNVYFVLFHLSGPLAHQREVRRALAGVVRAHDLVWRALGRMAQPAVCLIPPGMLGHDPGRRRQSLARERARALLDAAGLRAPLRLRAAIHPLLQDRYGALTRSLLREWEALGCEIETIGSSMAQFRQAYQENRDIDLLLGRWISDHADPDEFTYGFFHSQRGRFRHYFASAEADRLVERARREARPAARAGLYREFEKLLDREDVVVPLFHDVDYRIAGPQVRALRLSNTPPYVNYATAGKAAPASDWELAAAGPRRRGGEIHVPLAGSVQTLDPTCGLLAEYVEVIPNVFEPLTRVEEGARIVPWLAAAYEALAGGRRYRFRLREDVRFHDGRRLTARDVRYSFERVLVTPRPESHFVLLPIRGARALRDGEAGELAGLRILSAAEFEIELEQPISFFPALLTNPLAVIVPEGCESFADHWRAGCAGTGPFRLLRLEPGERIELERNPDYWRPGYPKSDRLVFHCGVSPEAILEQFRHERLSLASDLRPADVEALRRDPELAAGYRESPRLATYFLILNAHHGPFADPERRRAFARDLEVRRPLDEAAGVLVSPARGIIPPGLLGYEADERSGESIPRDRPTAWSIRLRAVHHPVFAGQYALFWERLCAAARAAGMEIESERRSPDEVLGLAREGKVDLIAYRWVADYPDTDGFIGNLLHSGEGSLAGIASAPEIDRLIERGRSETDPALRHVIYREIEETLEREALVIPLFHEQIYRFCHPGVCGFRFGIGTPEVLYEELYVKH